jgi:hypothetical protein
VIPFPTETAETVFEYLAPAMAKDYGDYQARKDRVLAKGRARFRKLALGWQAEERIWEARVHTVYRGRASYHC